MTDDHNEATTGDEHPSTEIPIDSVVRQWTEEWWAAAKPETRARRCIAHRKTGDRCKRAALTGQRVCGHHGGKAKQSLMAARRRLMENADPAVKQLAKIAYDDNVAVETRLKATLALIDRSVGGPKSALEVEVSAKPFEQVLEGMADQLEITSRAEFRRAQGAEDDESDDDESDDDDPLAGLHAADVAKVTADESRRRDAIRYGASDSNVIDAETVEIDGDVIDYGHTITPGDYEREPTRLGVPTLDPLTGRPAFDPADFDGPMTMEQANDVVAEINRRNAERMQRERADTGRAVVHPVRRALPRGRS